MALTRYQFVDGKYRIVHEKPPRRKPGPKPKPKKPKKQPRREVCPDCGRTIRVLVLYGWRGLRYVNHYRPSGGQCSKAMEPYER